MIVDKDGTLESILRFKKWQLIRSWSNGKVSENF